MLSDGDVGAFMLSRRGKDGRGKGAGGEERKIRIPVAERVFMGDEEYWCVIKAN